MPCKPWPGAGRLRSIRAAAWRRTPDFRGGAGAVWKAAAPMRELPQGAGLRQAEGRIVGRGSVGRMRLRSRFGLPHGRFPGPVPRSGHCPKMKSPRGA
ncbi:protein of unknown function [Cupriavidus taiwanensis]|uniref:Uncharacterized protein n=1 Tax=Cupriavidus taiwanensis TaxID=164546 RepID=A0A9Q7UV50_9BURK|nr:protein of unknown function [Cupriavidus taiwanensis]